MIRRLPVTPILHLRIPASQFQFTLPCPVTSLAFLSKELCLLKKEHSELCFEPEPLFGLIITMSWGVLDLYFSAPFSPASPICGLHWRPGAAEF